LRDIGRANRLFGGVAPIAKVVEETGATTVLDVGCGGADIPRALVRRASRRGRRLSIVCLDRSEQVLAIAARRPVEGGDLTFVRGDATALPFEPNSFDVAMCSLTLHHLAPREAVLLLHELRRVSRLTPLVCDLRRSPLAYAGVWMFTRCFTRNPLTRHDGPASVLRAYTPGETVAMAHEAGWRAPRVRCERWFRMTLVDGAF
jgi:ubiquinone/menaquinone biosynthesis C-methylase UbiE